MTCAKIEGVKNRPTWRGFAGIGAALVLIVAVAHATIGQAPASKAHLTEAQLLDLQKSFQDATVAADPAAIGKLMSDDAIFVHGNALVQTKAEFVEAATKGQFRITNYEIKNARVVFFDGGAILSGVQDVALAPREAGAQPLQVQMRVSSVWVPKPRGWQLILNQGTPIQAPPPPAVGANAAPPSR
jgi:ketosteroid isomerase-like protein